jgi:acetylornithine deacetylase/succinyl-diaminopimelate desuccinylase-like protein
VTEPALISTDQLINNLDQLIALPGSPGHPEELVAVAGRVAALMRGCGLAVETVATAGAPLVVGRRTGRSPFSLLVYHHYDVAPPGPWRAWHHDPYQLAELDSVLHGRGVASGKGPLIAHLNAIAALLEADGDLPCGVVVVAEGDGMAGSPHLAAALADHRDLLRADAVLATGGERDATGRPFCYSGAKGLLQVRLRSTGAAHTLPAGLAASVPNPLWRLLWALGQIKSDQEEILIEGFYDTIEGPARNETRALRDAALDEQGRQAAWQLQQFLFAMTGPAVMQAETTLPTCNITSFAAEPVSELAVIPTSATARLDFQLVPRQHPQVICDLLCEHLNAKGLADIQVERIIGGYPAAQIPIDDPFVALVSATGRHIHGEPLVILPRGPFAQPLGLFGQAYSIPYATVGLARYDSAVIAPNEHIPLPDLVRHGQLLIELLYVCAQRVPRPPDQVAASR